MPNPFFSGRISPDLEAHIEEWRAKTGESKTEVLVNALESYTKFQSKQIKAGSTEITNPVSERLNKIEERLAEIDDLKEQLDQLKESLKAEPKPQKTTTESDSSSLPLFTAQPPKPEEEHLIDNNTDNADNAHRAGTIVCPEAEMIRATGLTRNKLRYLREKIEQGKEDPTFKIKAEIKGKRYLLQYRGEEKEGKKKVRVWVAFPQE